MKVDEKRMSLVGHLGELRSRLIKTILAVVVGMSLTYSFSGQIIEILRGPYVLQLYSLSPTEAFWTTIKISFFSGLVVSFPVVLFQVWRFVSPGLQKEERRLAFPFLVSAFLLFLIGLVFCRGIVLPFALKFLIGFGLDQGIDPRFSVGMYVDFSLRFLLIFGFIFELPLVLVLLSWLGWVTPKTLSRNRRYAILINAILAAFLTPTSDIFNMTLTMLPMVVLYEIGIVAVRLFGRKDRNVPDSVGPKPQAEV